MHDKNDLERFRDLIKDVRIAMLTTIDEQGALRCRPMATQEVDFDGEHLWFFTRSHGGKADEIRHDERVCVAYAQPRDQRYVSVSGRARLVTDRSKMKQLWSPLYRAWFPEGVQDPALALLAVRVEKAELWDTPPGAVVQLLGFAKAAITGQPKRTREGEHTKIDFETHAH